MNSRVDNINCPVKSDLGENWLNGQLSHNIQCCVKINLHDKHLYCLKIVQAHSIFKYHCSIIQICYVKQKFNLIRIGIT